MMQTPERWTISTLTRYVRQVFETDYRLQDVEVEGEMSDFRIPSSGHAYFTLKDDKAQLRCVMWRSDMQAQSYIPNPGDHVIARGHLSVYEASGQYQLYCSGLSAAGVGDLHTRLERLKKKLQDEGLFDPDRKREIPLQPRVIGIVTSPSTAALQDVLNVIERRYPIARVILSPTMVQGDAAPPQIVSALEAVNTREDIDVVLLVRGGGSLEDLWCFNDEQVVRAVANSRIPVISGVGHEIDFTLADFAADLRAPTPSAAAELATAVTVDELLNRVKMMRMQLDDILADNCGHQRQMLERATQSLRILSPRAALENQRQNLDMLELSLQKAMIHRVAIDRERLKSTGRALEAISPTQTLARGYAIVQREDGRIVRKPADTVAGSKLLIHTHGGEIDAIVAGKEN